MSSPGLGISTHRGYIWDGLDISAVGSNPNEAKLGKTLDVKRRNM